MRAQVFTSSPSYPRPRAPALSPLRSGFCWRSHPQLSRFPLTRRSRLWRATSGGKCQNLAIPQAVAGAPSPPQGQNPEAGSTPAGFPRSLAPPLWFFPLPRVTPHSPARLPFASQITACPQTLTLGSASGEPHLRRPLPPGSLGSPQTQLIC